MLLGEEEAEGVSGLLLNQIWILFDHLAGKFLAFGDLMGGHLFGDDAFILFRHRVASPAPF